ncbi:MAG: hypothetical protein AB2777_21545, partial [Candidatus Thiodiazotropha endolucinida]
HYEQVFPYVDGGLNDNQRHDQFPYTCPFDYESECRDCKNVHTCSLGNGHEDKFCTKPTCYLEKCEAAKIDNESEGDDQGPEVNSGSTPPGASTATVSTNHESSEDPELPEQNVNSWLDKQAQQKLYKEQVSEAVKSASPDQIDSILVYSYSLDSDEKIDGEEPTIQAISQRIQVDADGMKRIAASNAIGYLLHNDVEAIGKFLGVTTDETAPRPTDENLELEV